MNFSVGISNLAFCAFSSVKAQDGKTLNKEPMVIPDNTLRKIDSLNPQVGKGIKTVNRYRVTYLSDRLKVIGFIAQPKQKGIYPCIICKLKQAKRQFTPLNLS